MIPGGRRAALLQGALAFAPLLLLGETVALLRAAGPLDASAGAVLRAGAMAPSFVHRVPVEIRLTEATGTQGLFGGAFEVGFTLRVALLLATAGAGWLLFRGGRAGGGPRAGLLVAVPYTLLSVGAAVLAGGSDPAILLGAGFAEPGQTEAWPSLLWSAALPASLAVACGAAGGLSSSRPDERGWLRAALAGGWRMAWLVVAGGTVGILVVVALHPVATRAFLDSLGARGWTGGAAVLVVTILFLPNLGVGAGAAAMGAPIELHAGSSTCTVASLAQLGGHGSACGGLPVGALSPAYAIFVLVPLAATVGGGWRVGGLPPRARVTRGAAVAALAGIPFAVLLTAFSFLASIAYQLVGPLADALGEGSVTVGPPLLPTLGWALLWGAIGGGVGGALAAGFGNRSGPGRGPGPNVSAGSL
ncbi:MAG: hypothetical protein ACRDKA_02355 [Actinomycetota bacterium]